MNEQGSLTWKPVFIALTDKDVLLYDTAPWSKEEWATPFQSHPLLATRYSIPVHRTYSTEHVTRMWIVKHSYSEVPDVKQIWCVMNVIFLNIWYSKFIIQFQTIWSNTDFAVNINLLSVLVVTLFYHTGNLSWNVCVYRTIDSYYMCKWILYQIIFSTNLSWLDIRDCIHLAELTVNKYSC